MGTSPEQDAAVEALRRYTGAQGIYHREDYESDKLLEYPRPTAEAGEDE